MLIFLSDMHLTDQTLAPSVPIDTLERFLKDVEKLVVEQKEIEIILLGDIFDILRSSRWLVKIAKDSSGIPTHIPVNVRPWHAIDSPLERIVSTILDDIKRTYGEFFQKLKRKGDIKITWVPGNHDRIVKITKAGERFLLDMGIEASDDYQIQRNDYGVLARHGHCFDEYNIRDKNYKLSPFGDAVVIELLNNLQVTTAAKRKIVNFNNTEIAFLGAVEYLRPYARVPLWINKRTSMLEDKLVRNRVRDAWCKVVDDFTSNEMFELLSSNRRALFSMLLGQSKNFGISFSKLVGSFEKLLDNPEKYKHYAKKDASSNLGIKYIVYGHTHFPGEFHLGDSKYYFNTGWWERSYEPQDLEVTPYMKHFNYLICRSKPELKQIPINSPIAEWEPPDNVLLSPAESFVDSLKAKENLRKEATLERGVLDLLAGTNGIKILNLQEKGFDMIISNNVKPSILGKKIAVEVKSGIKAPDIKKIANNIEQANIDNAWLFTFSEVNNALKLKAKEQKIKIFDFTDINQLSRGQDLSSFLTARKKNIL